MAGFDKKGALARAARLKERYPWLETGVGPSDELGPTVEVRIPVGSEIPYLPNSYNLMELHIVAQTEEQKDAILAVNPGLRSQVVVGDAPHVSPLGRMASRVASLAPPAPSVLVSMARRLAAEEDDGKAEAAGWAYHITYYKDLGSIESSGLVPGGGGSMGKGGYSGHSQGRTFMTEEAGLFFWFGRMEEHATNDSDDPLEDGRLPVVLRFPEPEGLEDDGPGTSDARAGSYYLEGGVPPEDMEVWDGSSWIPLADWDSIDPEESFELDEDGGEEWHVFKDQNPLYPG